MSPASFLISYNIVILHFVKNERSSYMHALRAYFLYCDQRNETLCLALCKFSVYFLILLITFDTEGGFIALWNFVFFQSHRFLGFLR